MYEAGVMNDVELYDVLEAAGLKNERRFTIDAFEAIVEEIAERSEGSDEDTTHLNSHHD